MKKIKFLFLALILTTPFIVKAQENVVKINIFSPLVRTLNVQYERAISDNGSVQLGFFYTGVSVESTRFSGFGLTPEYRFYLSDTSAPEGFYLAPFVRYQNFNLSDDNNTDDKAIYTAIGGGLLIGKQWIFKERIALDIFIGPSYSSGSLEIKSGSSSSYDVGIFDGFGVRTGLSLGISF